MCACMYVSIVYVCMCRATSTRCSDVREARRPPRVRRPLRVHLLEVLGRGMHLLHDVPADRLALIYIYICVYQLQHPSMHVL